MQLSSAYLRPRQLVPDLAVKALLVAISQSDSDPMCKVLTTSRDSQTGRAEL